MRLLFLAFLIPFVSSAQTYRGDGFGISTGLIVSIGSHVNSIGLSFNTYYTNYFFQVNAGTQIRFNGTSYGKRVNFFENRNSIGLVLLGGKKQLTPDWELDGLFHNTSYNYGIAYNYIWYFDKAGTTQRSGGWGLHLKQFSVLLENDVFGGQAKDRFRTGHLAFQYKYLDYKFSTGLYIWTGETAKSSWQKISLPKTPSGFRILEDLPYGKTSHGVLYGGIRTKLPFGQVAGVRIGVDSEHIRHSFQNRLTHDLIILPEKVERNTPHYPRLDENGCPVFEKCQVRKDKFYFLVNLNENWSN